MAVLPVGLRKIGLMYKLVNLVVVQKAKNEVIQPVDLKIVYQVRHLRLLERCQQQKKLDLNVKKQVVKR